MFMSHDQGRREVGAGWTMTPGPMEFREPIGSRKAVGFSDSEDLFFLYFGRKKRCNFGEDLFFFRRSHHNSDQTAAFLRLFWTSQNRKSDIFELASGPRLALGAPGHDRITLLICRQIISCQMLVHIFSYHYPYMFFWECHERNLGWNWYGSVEDCLPFHS